MVPLAPGTDSRRAALDLVEHGVATAPGTAFGDVAGDQLRLSLAASEDGAARRDRTARRLGQLDGGRGVAHRTSTT